MTNINLDELSLKELKQLKKRVEQAIDTFKDRQKKQALAELEEVAREKGFSLAELTTEARKMRKPVPPKYANPDNPEMTWTGRGRKPKWVIAHLEKGKALDDLLIRK